MDIISESLTAAVFPENFKEALLRPLLKKTGLDLILSNYHPVSNLSFASKLVEWVVCQEITKFTEESGNLEPMQSAFHEAHSTETALLKVKSDILNAVNNKDVIGLVLLDLSLASDTMNHQLLLNHLKYHFGFQGKVLQLLESYLTGCTQKDVLKMLGKHQNPHPNHWNGEFHRDLFWVQSFSHCILHPWETYAVLMVSSLIAMLTTPNFT